MKRRDVMKNLAFGTAAGVSGILRDKNEAVAQTYSNATSGLPQLKITKVKCIATAPNGVRLNVVKVETSEPGLYGLGCATFQQRPSPVVAAVNDYLDDFCRGKDVDNIEDIWQTAYMDSNWRNGPVLNNAMSGLDMALWDIKGKRANMPLYQLLGGKSRFAVSCYTSTYGRDFAELEDGVQKLIERGYRVVKIQMSGGYYKQDRKPPFKDAGFGMPSDRYMNPVPYITIIPKMFEHIRNKFGDEIELLHDMVYERINPIDAINVIKLLEPYRPYFIEDPIAAEDIGYYKNLRQQTGVPIALGEEFNHPLEWIDIISGRLIDFIRCHISQIGGITPAIKIARFCEWFNIRSAWHGPNDVSPVGHAANAHIDLAIWNFGIQEFRNQPQETHEVFPGCPKFEKDKEGYGYMYVNETPGLGVDLDEKLAAKFPHKHISWSTNRRGDGTSIRR
ncbi:enolase C-terminal domain-like protein [Candidatus Latescibacterota bacterium]